MTIYCCCCNKQVEARLTDGKEIYPHRPDLYNKPFWKCDVCKNYVGCHPKNKNPLKPPKALGYIALPKLKKARQFIHKLIDPLWMPKNFHKRGIIYGIMTEKLGSSKRKGYHTAELKSLEEAREAYKIAKIMPTLLEERQLEIDAILKEWLKIQPIKGREYLVFYREKWIKSVFEKMEKSSCQLHGEPSLGYYFEHCFFSIDADFSLKRKTEELKKMMKEAKA